MTTPTEHQEQVAVIRWANENSIVYPELNYLFAVPNGTKKNRIARTQSKYEGLKSGVPDLILPVARGGFNHLYVEMKTIDGGKVSDTQKDWIKFLNANGSKAIVCNGAEEAKKVIFDYLKKN